VGQEYSADNGVTWIPAPSETVGGRTRAVPLSAAEFISGNTTVLIRTAASGRRPRTANQAVTPQPRATVTPPALVIANGRITTDLKAYEILNPANGRWGNLPKINEDGTHSFLIRLKATAKQTKGVWEGNAASMTADLIIEREGGGIKTAVIAAVPARLELQKAETHLRSNSVFNYPNEGGSGEMQWARLSSLTNAVQQRARAVIQLPPYYADIEIWTAETEGQRVDGFAGDAHNILPPGEYIYWVAISVSNESNMRDSAAGDARIRITVIISE
jgi:hypothetical protein